MLFMLCRYKTTFENIIMNGSSNLLYYERVFTMLAIDYFYMGEFYHERMIFSFISGNYICISMRVMISLNFMRMYYF